MRRGLLAAIGLGLLSLPVAAETLVVAGDPWCPFNCQPGSKRPGIFIELARELFAEQGIAVEYQSLNWARALRETRAGHLNAVVGAGVEDAPDFIFPATPIAYSEVCFYARRGTPWRYRAAADLAGVRLGVINDYSYGRELDQYIARYREQPERIQVAAGEQALGLNLGKLLSRRIDATLENSWVMQHRLRHYEAAPAIQQAGCRAERVPIYLAFSPALGRSVEHVRLLEEGWRRYRADGRWQRLLEHYGVSEAR